MDERQFREAWRHAEERHALLARPEAQQHHSLALKLAVECGDAAMARHLLTWEEARVDLGSREVRKGMRKAVSRGHVDCVLALLEAGMEPWDGCNALNIALSSPRGEIARALLDTPSSGAWYDHRTSDQEEIEAAAEGGDLELVRECLARGLFCTKDIGPAGDRFPWHAVIDEVSCAEPVNIPVLAALLENEEIAPGLEEEDRDPLVWALRYGNHHVVAHYWAQSRGEDAPPPWRALADFVRGD